MDFKTGLLCSLTNAKPVFEKECKDFVLDEKVKVRQPDDNYLLTADEIKQKIPEIVFNQLYMEQNLPAAIITGFLSSIVGAGIWAFITIETGFQFGFMAVIIGAIVGFVVRTFGKGITKKFGCIGAAFSLFGCILGNIFSFTALIANHYSIGFWVIFSQLNFNLIWQMMVDWFSLIDLLFYAIAIIEGYRFALKQITEKTVKTVLGKTQ